MGVDAHRELLVEKLDAAFEAASALEDAQFQQLGVEDLQAELGHLTEEDRFS